MSSVAFDQVWKVYDGSVEAVKGVSLEAKSGEFLVLVGPSGCGKTTMLRMVAGLEEITKGEIRIDGRVVNDVEPKDRDIAMVFQNYALYPHMTVAENMGFGLKMRKTPKAEIQKRVSDAAQVLGLSDLLSRKPKALSGGQRQRVALGRALVRDPKVFLLDEPLSNLDAKLRVDMRAELKRLHRKLKTTILYVTHDQMEAMTLGDRIAVLKDGRIQQAGSPLDLYDRPANRFVAGFLGSPAMNFLEGTVEGSGFRVGTSVMGLPSAWKAKPGPAVLGIRPEGITEKGSLRFSAQVDVVELLGDECLLYLIWEGKTLIARMDAHFRAKPGDRVELGVGERAMHLFDAQSGENLTVQESVVAAGRD